MLGTAIKTFVKVMFTLGAVFAVLAGITYLCNNKNEYIEIYDDGHEDFE